MAILQKALAVAFLPALLVISGCSAADSPPDAPLPVAKPIEDAEVPPPLIEPGTVVATGILEGGAVSGNVSIVALEGGGFDVRLDEIATQLEEQLTPYFSTQPYEFGGYCEQRTPMVGYGRATMGSSYSFTLDGFGFGEPLMGNPNYLDDLLLTSFSTAHEDCFYPVVAAARLTWSLPDMRPDLEVSDAGVTGGATGVAETVDGSLRTYTVANGDVMKEIAARFGVEVDDLFYLNPGRSPSPQHPMAYAGEVLNLDKASR